MLNFLSILNRFRPKASLGIRQSSDPSVIEFFNGSVYANGASVTPANALRSTVVWRCVGLIAGAIMSLPISIYERTSDGRRKIEDHPYTILLCDAPNDTITAAQWFEMVVIDVLLRGNSYAMIVRKGPEKVAEIEYYSPWAVFPFKSKTGEIWYRFTGHDGNQKDVHSSDVLHFSGPGFDGLKGMSAIEHCAKSVGIGINAGDYTSKLFSNGLLTNNYFKFPERLTPEQREAFQAYIKNNQGVANSHRPLILAEGGEWKQTGFSARDAQLLELMQYSAIDIARIFGVPPHMIGEVEKTTSWGTGIEQQGIGFVTYTLRPHLRRFEKEITRKLFPSLKARSKFFVEFNVDGLMQGDSKARAEFYRIALGGNQLPGFMSINEVRRVQNLPRIEGCDEVYDPSRYLTASSQDPSGINQSGTGNEQSQAA